MGLYPMGYLLQRPLRVRQITAKQRTADNCILPDILLTNFRHRDIKFPVQARQQGFQPAAFFLQRTATGKFQLQGQYAEGHKSYYSIIQPMNSTKAWVFVLGFLIITAAMAFSLVWIIRDTIQRTVVPVQSMTGDLSTSVSSFLNPTPTILPNPITVICDVRSLARLETIQYTVEKVITAETNQGVFGRLFGDKLIFVARGKVIAGVNLELMSSRDLSIENGVLTVRLPEAEVFISALDNEKSYVYQRDTGLLTKGDIQLESTARYAAEKEIEKAAVEDGILEQARKNAESMLYRLFIQLGYSDVIFIAPTTTPAP